MFGTFTALHLSAQADAVSPHSVRGGACALVVRADRVARAAGPVDLLVLGPGHDVQVPLAIVPLVPADQTGTVELVEVVLDLQWPVLGPQGPQSAGDDGGLVTEAAVVVGLGEQSDEGPLGVDAHCSERLGDEGFGLDGAYACQGRVLTRRPGGCGNQARRRSGVGGGGWAVFAAEEAGIPVTIPVGTTESHTRLA